MTMTMNKYLIGFIVFILLVAGIIFFIGTRGGFFNKKAQATFNDQKVILDIADSPKEREMGLSGRNSLSDNRGMLFLFDEPVVPSFWMKGMKFSIDIIFINNDKIVTIYKNVPAPKTTTEIPSTYYQPTDPINKVIELKAGMADKFGLKVGDSIKLTL